MSSEKPKWWKTPPYSNIVGTLTSALILWIIKLVYDWWVHTPVLSTVGEFFIFVWASFLSFLALPIPLGSVISLFLLYFILYYSYKLLNRTKAIEEQINLLEVKQSNDARNLEPSAKPVYAPISFEEEEEEEEKFLSYKAAKFYDNVWTWELKKHKLTGEYEIKNLTLICKNDCDYTPMKFVTGDSVGYLYWCDKCKEQFYIKETTIEIQKSIMDKIKKF